MLEQNHQALEYIVIDGGSTDESVAVIRRYEDKLAYWVSEPDRGQAHAINKGLEHATGEIIGYLNSDDIYLPGAFAAVISYFQKHPECQWLCGDTMKFGELHETIRPVAIVPRSAAHCLSWAYDAPQPGMFWRRDLLRNGFAERWRYCFDHELYVRLLLAGHRCEHLPATLAGYRLHPTSKTMAEGHLFGAEFDEIAKIYEPQLRGSGRRWSRATRELRRSLAASRAGRTGEAVRYLLRGLLIHPEGLRYRLFWGSLRLALTSRRFRTHERPAAE